MRYTIHNNRQHSLRTEFDLTLQLVSLPTGLAVSAASAIENEERKVSLGSSIRLALENIWQRLYQQNRQRVTPAPDPRSHGHDP
jgi:hypothetical protein